MVGAILGQRPAHAGNGLQEHSKSDGTGHDLKCLLSLFCVSSRTLADYSVFFFFFFKKKTEKKT